MARNIIWRSLSDIILLLLSALLVLIAALSLRWRMGGDSVVALYFAFLMDHFHYVPYRDFWDINFPGLYFVYLVVGRCFGYGDFSFRCADLLYLSAISTATWFWMKNLGWKVARCGVVLFGLVYLGFGPLVSMQREYLMLLPIVLACLVSTSFRNLDDARRCMIIGFLFGLAATIKPHVAIALPLVVGFELLDVPPQLPPGFSKIRRSMTVITFLALGFAAPFVVVFAYLFRSMTLPIVWSIVKIYWPLYAGLTIDYQTISGAARLGYLCKGYLTLGGHVAWLAPSAIGVYIALFHSHLTAAQKRHVILLVGLTFCYSVYTLVEGKFWRYHWLLFLYFLLMVSSLCLVEQPHARKKCEQLFPLIVILVAIFPGIILPYWVNNQFAQLWRPLGPPQGGRVDEIASYLKAHVESGDTVQPLDSVLGGAVHAMLIAEVQLATPFVDDTQFYHHISSRHTQNLRTKFIEDLKSSQPRWIVKNEKYREVVRGPDTTGEFKELQSLLDNSYSIVFIGDGYIVYRRR